MIKKCLVKEQVIKHMTVSSVRVRGWVQVRSHEVHLSPCTKDIYSFIQTFFPQQEIQEVVGVGHAHFSLHLRPTKGGVDVAWASPLFCPPQLRKPTPHVSVTEERRKKREKKRWEMKREKQRRVLTETQVGDMKLMEFLNIQKTLALARECVR